MSAETAQAATPADKLLYTGKVHITGGHERGSARSSDGHLDIKLSVPGGPGTGTNPEQLLAAGWSACYESAVSLLAHQAKVTLPAGFAIDTEIDLNLGSNGYFLRARLNVSLPGLDRAVAQKLIDDAHGVCPYSKALHGNIDITTTLV
jgi:Ohr subfamily peroxiredoxin